MKKLFLFTLLACAFTNAFAQKYFQQEVNYRINVTLDDVAHTITGDIIIEYTNNSPNRLDSIWMHLWGNAFKNQNTAFAKQKLRNGDTKFYFAKDSDLGYYSGLDFSIYGQKVNWAFDKNNPDIAVLRLAQPLEPSGKIVMKTPFTLKIPASWSRLGHVGTSYQMTQWFPKPAVYDAQGWHPIPYLDQGEFYSEFGSFDVTITLPENYVVGATGVLQTESEVKFLDQKVAETQEFIKNGFPKGEEFPASATATKTLHYTAEQVHDFAWFADKRFHVVKDEAVLPSGKKIPTWGMFTNKEADIWTRGAGYVKRAVEFYSQNVGEYPWPQATAVHSALSAGGGMEYPMITVIGNSSNARGLDDVITHEVGHNWFYGLLASNERDHPWMDEGMNSYYEYRYMVNYYGSRADFGLPKFVSKMIDGDLYELVYGFQCRRRLDQAPETTSDDLASLNYGISAYIKPGSAFGHLEQYLGTAEFDRIMKKYYDLWHFKHPLPSDLQAIFEKETGKNLGWFFDGYLKSIDQLDYSLKKISSDAASGFQVLVKNRGEIAAPFPITAYRDTVAVRTEWFEGFTGEKTVDFPATDCDRLVLDGGHVTLDIYRKNNTIKTSGELRTMEPLKLRLLGPLESSKNTTLNFLPIVGWNKYDGGMAGLLLHNGIVPARKFEYQLATMYGFNSKDLAGMANMQYNIYPKTDKIKQLSFGANSKAFNFREGMYTEVDGAVFRELLQYRRIVPFVRLDLMKSPNEKFYQEIQLRSIFLQEQQIVSDFSGSYSLEWNNNTINEASWELGDRRALNPYSFRLALEQRSYDDIFNPKLKRSYVRASLEVNTALTYDRKRNIYVRGFFGGFLKNDYRNRGVIAPGAYNLTGQGFNDYRYDEYFFGRTEVTGSFSQQISTGREGGLKVPFGSPYSEGRSNNFIFAINLKADLPQDLPLKLPLKPYFDFGYFDDNRPISSDLKFADQVWWQGGVALEFGKGIFGVYIPIVNSKTLRGTDNLPGLYDSSGRDKFLERIAFTLDLAKLSPWKLAEGIQL
ncbi:MAG: M1 family metallopeptidase [Saprospiraceae bacterium]|nr:M1 family metallopeptidase [Saprospiraceae bacterium]MCF8251185.1 M1 family metallopeptidase [Saprospiraceae bacterium]MCF8282382.1 M1 family metallopeptidase [Bacteroidales bacterium]MCF8312997.1 M1 family metallopeptidase [Saprospiraceae bacterium]MCF8441444.1 M1 family metallopeptidase [Saprospiraceae bacterium]